MENTPTIRAEIVKYLKQKGLTMTEFGHTIDLNVGTISGIVTGNRSISVHQLDSITAGMNLPPDYFYERFIEECIEESPLNWRKISPFVYRCAELNQLDCLQRVVSLLLDSPTYPSLLFEVAEDSFQKGYKDAAAYLYEKVSESEKQQYSERLAFCQYRLFTIRIGEDQIQNLQTAARFEPFIDRLDEVDQLDALKDLANLYRALSQWHKVYQFAQMMKKRAKIRYGMKQESNKKPSRPPFVYIAYADLLCAYACDARGDYEQGLKHLKAHTDLSWVKEKDPESQHWLGLFQGWAKINTYVNRLMSGDVSVLPDYVEYIAGENEIFAELLNVVEAANRYNLDIDHILERFESQIAAYREPESLSNYFTVCVSYAGTGPKKHMARERRVQAHLTITDRQALKQFQTDFEGRYTTPTIIGSSTKGDTSTIAFEVPDLDKKLSVYAQVYLPEKYILNEKFGGQIQFDRASLKGEGVSAATTATGAEPAPASTDKAAQITTPVAEQKPVAEQPVQPAATEKQYTINYNVFKDKTGEASVMDGYLDKPATLIEKGDKRYIQVTLKNSSWMPVLQVEQNGTLKDVEVISTSGDTRVVQFEVGDLSRKISAYTHVIVPGLVLGGVPYDHWYTVQFQFDEASLKVK